MSSLHTTHRPATWDAVLGQDSVVKSLKRVVKDNRAHSFLFTGPPGTGKTSLARILASCLVGDKSTIVNVEEVDGASKSGADDARSLVAHSLYRAIGASPIKFIIIDEAHRLSAAAWTVMLKPMEEPPAHVYYALCTTDAAKIPKAIITRCLRYDLKPVKEDKILELLISVVDAEKLDVSDEIIEAVAENSGGSPRQALVFLEECLACKDANEARSHMRDAGQSKEVIDLARWLLAGKGHTWLEAVKYLKAIQSEDAESCRIKLQNYFAAVMLGAKSDKIAQNVLSLIECFKTPYYSPDKMASLVYSVGLAIKLDQS